VPLNLCVIYHKQDFIVSCFGTCFMHQFVTLKSVYDSLITCLSELIACVT